MRPAARLALLLLAAACTALPRPRASPYHASDADLAVTRIVHGSLLVEMSGTRVLIDPWFHSGFVTRQREPLGLVPTGLPTLAAVLLTHAHPDHFDPEALTALARTVPRAIAPPALHARLAALGFREVDALDWWDHIAVDGITVTAVPARHAVRENGYVLATPHASAYVAGDTRWFPELVDIAVAFPGLDAAMLPVGGLRLLGFRREMGPDEAARAAELLGAQHLIPVAYGAWTPFPWWWYARDSVRRFVAACKARGIASDRVVVLEPGESWHLYK